MSDDARLRSGILRQRLLGLPPAPEHAPRICLVDPVGAYGLRDVLRRARPGQGWRTPSPASTAR